MDLGVVKRWGDLDFFQILESFNLLLLSLNIAFVFDIYLNLTPQIFIKLSAIPVKGSNVLVI